MEGYYNKIFIPFVVAAVAIFSLVVLIPFGLGFFYSFTAWRGTHFAGGGTALQAFVGLQNYIAAFNSPQFMGAFLYTIQFTLISAFTINIISLGLALTLTSIKTGTGAYRTIFFMPNLLGGLALGFIWQFIFQIIFTDILFSQDGFMHIEFLRHMTMDSTRNLFALTMLVSWQSAGYMMLIYITGLNSIPDDLYESASIDGASSLHKFRHITVPMLMPSFTIVLFLTLANAFKTLDQNVALSDGNFGTRLLALQILRTINDTSPSDYGLAQAQAVIFFLVVAGITLVQVSITKKKEVEM